MIGKDHEDFIQKVDTALTLKNDKDYGELLRREAIENTWESKVQLITKLLGTSFSGLFNIETLHEDRIA